MRRRTNFFPIGGLPAGNGEPPVFHRESGTGRWQHVEAIGRCTWAPNFLISVAGLGPLFGDRSNGVANAQVRKPSARIGGLEAEMILRVAGRPLHLTSKPPVAKKLSLVTF